MKVIGKRYRMDMQHQRHPGTWKAWGKFFHPRHFDVADRHDIMSRNVDVLLLRYLRHGITIHVLGMITLRNKAYWLGTGKTVQVSLEIQRRFERYDSVGSGSESDDASPSIIQADQVSVCAVQLFDYNRSGSDVRCRHCLQRDKTPSWLKKP